jgi:hypothetical protein
LIFPSIWESVRSKHASISPVGVYSSRTASLARVEQLLEMALGVFTSAGVVHLQLGRKADVAEESDLLVCSLDELKTIAAEKGGTRVLLDD